MKMSRPWREITRNCWVANPIAELSISVHRNPSWKRLGHEKPWRIEVFGNVWISRRTFAELEDAQLEAEKIAVRIAKKLTRKLSSHGAAVRASTVELFPPAYFRKVGA